MDQNIQQEASQKIQKVLELIKTDLGTIRTGRAAPSLVESIVISAYQGSARLKVMELATIMSLDSQTLVITPFDTSTLDDIQKGIMEANVGLTPSNDGTVLRISIPGLTQERRGELIKAMHHKLENGKVMVRQIRHEMMDEIKKMHDAKTVSDDEKARLEKEVQKVIDDTTITIDSMGKQKEAELLQL